MNDYKEIIVKEYRNEKGLITRREIGEEIVRCKDCKYYVPISEKIGECKDTRMNSTYMSYCSYGEKK